MNRIKLICPVCGEGLMKKEKSFVCPKGHSFDIARQGYVNLLPVQNKHSLSPGDTRDMLGARRRFLDSGHYTLICNDVSEKIRSFCKEKSPVIADIGSGEGYYTAHLKDSLNAECIGIDIAKEASKMSCQRDRDILWIVATASHLPVADSSIDAVTAVFSLYVNNEYARVLKSGGIVVEVTAGSRHLTELKQLIYDEVFEQHKQPSPFGDEFELIIQEDKSFNAALSGQELKDLLMMTPHIHRINREQSERINNISGLDITVNYIIRVMRKL